MFSFKLSHGSNAVDHRNGDGRISGRFEDVAVNWRYRFPNFEMLDAKIASALKKIIQNSNFKKRVNLAEQKNPTR